MADSIPRRRLLDLYTIYRERPLDGLSVAFIGELDQGPHGALAGLPAGKIRAREDLLRQPPGTPDEAATSLSISTTRCPLRAGIGLRHVVGEVDVIYQTRIRPERVRDVRGAEALRDRLAGAAANEGGCA